MISAFLNLKKKMNINCNNYTIAINTWLKCDTFMTYRNMEVRHIRLEKSL